MRGIVLASIILAASTGLAAAEVASLDVLQGRAMVDQGQGFKPADPGTALHTGDRVMVKANSAALVFSAETGCVLSLQKAGIYSMPDFKTCNGNIAGVMQSEVIITPTNGVYVAVPEVVAGAGSGTAMLVAGGFVAVVAGTFGWTTFIADDDSPASYY